MNFLSSFFLPILTCTVFIAAQDRTAETDRERAAIEAAIRCGARYAGATLLDSAGTARGDYNMMEGRWSPYEPAWHTGQIVFGLVEAFRITGDSTFLRHAQRAARWWKSLVITDQPLLNGMLRTIHGAGIEKICFTTLCDGTNGMFELARETGDTALAWTAVRAGRWALRTMYLPSERMFYDFVDPVTGAVQKDRSDFWPEKEHQVLTDVARPNNEGYLYRDMYRFTGDGVYRTVFLDLCDGLVRRQGAEGLWMEFTPNDAASGRFHPRFNLWYAESLLEGYAESQDRRYLEAAKRTLRFYARYQKKDGTIHYVNFTDGTTQENSPSGSTVAFAGLLWLRLLRLGEGEEFRGNIDRSFRWVMANRYPESHPDRSLAGGFMELRMTVRNGKSVLIHRDIATAFGLRFLAAVHRWKYAQ